MKAFDTIIPLISEKTRNIGEYIIANKDHLPLNTNSFKKIIPKNSNKTAFVDSGSGEILKGTSTTLSFIRLYSAIYNNNTRSKTILKELFALVTPNGTEEYQAKILDLEGNEIKNYTFNAFDPTLTINGRRAEPTTIINIIRKIMEFDFCTGICDELTQGDIIVRDGDLEANNCHVDKSLESLKNKANQKSLNLIGLAKTTRLYTDTGASAITALDKISPKGAWVFDPGYNTVFAKLHPKSKYIFRCDLITKKQEHIFQALAYNSTDPAFLGYPYGLLDADKFAQVTKQETEQLRVRFAVQSKEQFAVLESAINAHDILDTL